MKYAIFLIFLSSFAYAVTPIANDYKDSKAVLTEFRNVFDNAQDRTFTQVVASTPNYQEMREGEIFIYISSLTAPTIKLMIRTGSTIYASPDFNIIRGR